MSEKTTENKDSVKSINKWGEAEDLDLKYPDPAKPKTTAELTEQIGHDVKLVAQNVGALVGDKIGRTIRLAAAKIQRAARRKS